MKQIYRVNESSKFKRRSFPDYSIGTFTYWAPIGDNLKKERGPKCLLRQLHCFYSEGIHRSFCGLRESIENTVILVASVITVILKEYYGEPNCMRLAIISWIRREIIREAKIIVLFFCLCCQADVLRILKQTCDTSQTNVMTNTLS